MLVKILSIECGMRPAALEHLDISRKGERLAAIECFLTENQF